ncbi:MAG: hypothetical protein WCC64_05835 [Aliidongia sp.]
MKNLLSIIRLTIIQLYESRYFPFIKWPFFILSAILLVIIAMMYLSYTVYSLLGSLYSDGSNTVFIELEKWLIIQFLYNKYLPPLGIIVTSSAFFFLVGFIFFIIREKFRIWYGIVEIVIGDLTCLIGVVGPIRYINDPMAVSSVISKDQAAISFLTVLSGVYIIVRGMVNVKEGLGTIPPKK